MQNIVSCKLKLLIHFEYKTLWCILPLFNIYASCKIEQRESFPLFEVFSSPQVVSYEPEERTFFKEIFKYFLLFNLKNIILNFVQKNN